MLAGFSSGAAEAAHAVYLRLLHYSEFPHHHRHRPAQRPELGRGDLLRGDRQIQDLARGLPNRGPIPAARTGGMLHGRLPQLRPGRGQGGRLQDRLRAPPRRVGRRGPAGPDPQPDPRHRRRQLPRTGRGIGGVGLGGARGGPGGGKILDDGSRDATDQSCEDSGDLRGFARHDVAIPMPIVAVVGGRDGVGKSAGRGDIADVEDRHFLAPRSRRAAHPPVFIDGERSGAL